MTHYVQYVTSGEETIAYVNPENIDITGVFRYEPDSYLSYGQSEYDLINPETGDFIVLLNWRYSATYLKFDKFGYPDQTFNDNILSLGDPEIVGCLANGNYLIYNNEAAYDILSFDATNKYATRAWYRIMYSNNSDVVRYHYYKEVGFSVRLVKD